MKCCEIFFKGLKEIYFRLFKEMYWILFRVGLWEILGILGVINCDYCYCWKNVSWNGDSFEKDWGIIKCSLEKWGSLRFIWKDYFNK